MNPKFIELMDVLIESSIGIYLLNRQTTFNRVIPVVDLGVERVTDKLVEECTLYGDRIGTPVQYCETLRGFTMTIDLMGVTLNLKQARKLTGTY